MLARRARAVVVLGLALFGLAAAPLAHAEQHLHEAAPEQDKSSEPTETSETSGPQLEATVTGTRWFTAASARSVRDRDFLLRPMNSPEDILRVVPGLVLAQHQGGGKADQLFLRGFDADHGTDVSVLLDGIPVNLVSHAHGQGYADLHFLIPEAIERVEVSKGPYFADLGDFDTAGAVNLVTRDRFERSSVKGEYGSFGTYRVLGVAAPELGPVRPWFAAEVYGTQGPFVTPERLERYNLLAKSTFALADGVRLSVLASAYASSWTGSGQLPERLVDAGLLDRFGAVDPTEGGVTSRQQLVASLSARPEAGGAFTATASLVRYSLALFNDFTFRAVDPVNGDAIQQDDTRTMLAANLRYDRPLGEAVLSLGAQVRSDSIDGDLWHVKQRVRLAQCSAGRTNPCLATHTEETSGGAFAQLDWRATRWARLVLGLREDLFELDVRSLREDQTLSADQGPVPSARQRSILSPKASLVLQPLRWLELYANYGQGFHSNDARAAVLTGGSGALAKAIGYELGARSRLLQGKLDLAAAAWKLDLGSELVWSGDAGTTEAADPTTRRGLDLEVRYRPLPWLTADLDVTLARARFERDAGNGRAVALAPPLVLTGGLSARHPTGVFGAVRVRAIGARPATELTADDGVPHCTPLLDASTAAGQRCWLEAQGYFVVDAEVGFEHRLGQVALLVENATDAAYREAQFGNVSRVDGEPHPVTDLHFTPGNPRGARLAATLYF